VARTPAHQPISGKEAHDGVEEGLLAAEKCKRIGVRNSPISTKNWGAGSVVPELLR